MENKKLFADTEILELCDSIKDRHRILKTIGEFFDEIDTVNEKTGNGNGFLVDFKKWGVKTITSEILEKQNRKIKRLAEIYQEEQKRL